jgi:hypothetical protein
MNPLQQKAYDAVSADLPFAIDPAKSTIEPGLSYLPSPAAQCARLPRSERGREINPNLIAEIVAA